jgi:hypothetical protein
VEVQIDPARSRKRLKCRFSSRFSDGFSMLSITRTSTGPFVDSHFTPARSRLFGKFGASQAGHQSGHNVPTPVRVAVAFRSQLVCTRSHEREKEGAVRTGDECGRSTLVRFCVSVTVALTMRSPVRVFTLPSIEEDCA